jgi:hypothetical protein
LLVAYFQKERAMQRLSDLRFLFVVVAALELAYALIGLLPPGALTTLTGWDLSADGQWTTKLLAVALLSQAAVAWALRKQPHIGVAVGLAFYQVASATADWVMWILLSDDGVFAATTAQLLVLVAIPTHYALGILLLRAVRVARATPLRRGAGTRSPGSRSTATA